MTPIKGKVKLKDISALSQERFILDNLTHSEHNPLIFKSAHVIFIFIGYEQTSLSLIHTSSFEIAAFITISVFNPNIAAIFLRERFDLSGRILVN